MNRYQDLRKLEGSCEDIMCRVPESEGPQRKVVDRWHRGERNFRGGVLAVINAVWVCATIRRVGQESPDGLSFGCRVSLWCGLRCWVRCSQTALNLTTELASCLEQAFIAPDPGQLRLAVL